MEMLKISRATGVMLGFLAMAPMASATVMGELTLDSTPGDVLFSLGAVDWQPPAGGPGGSLSVGAGTTLTYTNVSGTTSALTPGTLGTVLDLMTGVVFPLTNFLTFNGAPGLRFDLMQIGPFPMSTNCATVLDPNLPACSAAPGTVSALVPTATGTTVVLTVRGTAFDNSNTPSTFSGAFSAVITGQTPAQVQATLVGGGSVRSTYAAEIVTTPIPEPGTVSLLGLGGALIAFAVRRRRAA
jgi:hypothetical protein